jgi:putative ABC transport system permease protein
MFSVTRTVLEKPLAYRDPARLVTILFRVPQFSKALSTIPVNAQHYELWRDEARTIEELGMLGPDSHILSGLGEAVQVRGARVSTNLFHLLGSQPVLGRAFARGEDQMGRDHVVVISHQFWREKLGGRPDALGQKVLFDGQPFQVIGIMPVGFPVQRGKELTDLEVLPERTDYWVPLVFSQGDLASPLGNENYIAIARFKPSATVAQVLADVTALEKVISKRYPEPVEFDAVVRPLQQGMVRDVRLPLLILMAAVGVVLLLACINLMNLMMVRGLARQREWAIRLSIGAKRLDLLLGALIESLCLSVTGGALGSLLAVWLLKLVQLEWNPGLESSSGSGHCACRARLGAQSAGDRYHWRWFVPIFSSISLDGRAVEPWRSGPRHPGFDIVFHREGIRMRR